MWLSNCIHKISENKNVKQVVFKATNRQKDSLVAGVIKSISNPTSGVSEVKIKGFDIIFDTESYFESRLTWTTNLTLIKLQSVFV